MCTTIDIYRETGGLCRMLPEPCKHSACRYHMASGPKPRGTPLPQYAEQTCALAAAESGPLSLQDVGDRIGSTREWVRQIEARAFEKIRRRSPDLYEMFVEVWNRAGGPSYPASGYGFEESDRKRNRQPETGGCCVSRTTGQSTSTQLQHSRDGRMLCGPHSRSGVPTYHTDGCDACEEARAKGHIRPAAGAVNAKRRGRGWDRSLVRTA
jgi:hypothetical protein